MISTVDLLLDILVKLVESVADQPKRVLFRGVSDLHDAFCERVELAGYEWTIQITGESDDIVGARNDRKVGTLVVFYRGELRERESLNAFRQFDENAIVEALVQHVVKDTAYGYTTEDEERLRILLALVYPSVDRLAAFLLEGKDRVGAALPYLGLFTDPELTYQLRLPQWHARIRENYASAVLRMRDFLEKGQRNRGARHALGVRRVELLRKLETEPRLKSDVLREITLNEALRILNPPTRIVEALMQAGVLREDAENLIVDIKLGKADPHHLPTSIPTLPEKLIAWLENHQPRNGDDPPPNDPVSSRVGFCLEGILRITHQSPTLPKQLWIKRSDAAEGTLAEISLSSSGQWQVVFQPNFTTASRDLSVPNSEARELSFEISGTSEGAEPLIRFTIENQATRLEPFAEIWPEQGFWEQASQIDAQHSAAWKKLQKSVSKIRNIVDPDWKQEQETGEAKPDREPNNSIYMIFDLLYLAHRAAFEEFLDHWISVMTLPWRASIAARQSVWLEALRRVADIGFAARSDGARAILPFHPLRLVWHRTVFSNIETWLKDATQSYTPLEFEPAVLEEQLQLSERPPAVFDGSQRLVEATITPFFSIFVPEKHQRRARAPLAKARQKLEQFGRMWPFSLTRFHLAYQPGDASDEVYRMLAHQAENEPDAAFRVRALVDHAETMTTFDQQLFTIGDTTTDLLTREHHESLLPRVDYAKGQLDNNPDAPSRVTAHVAILVDAFREDKHGFAATVGQLENNPHWVEFQRLVTNDTQAAHEQLKRVHLSAPAYHFGPIENNRRSLVYVPLNGNQPEYMRLLWDSVTASLQQGSITTGAYYEQVRWNASALERLHHCADWVILFDRSLDKSLFDELLTPQGIRLIDFYPALAGGYRLSVSSKRVEAVEWQLVQVLQQFFHGSGLDLLAVAREMIKVLSGFASGLLLKTLGGGSLAQELLGLYATYQALIADGEFTPGKDWLIPLDDYQGWFGRRTPLGRRADLLVLRSVGSNRMEMLAVESKWYKKTVSTDFVADEFGTKGQLRTATTSLYSLFEPNQVRLDRDYWQKTLIALAANAPESLRQTLQTPGWQLVVDGIVYVHQYMYKDPDALAKWSITLNGAIAQHRTPQEHQQFALGPDFNRLRLKSYPELVDLVRA